MTPPPRWVLLALLLAGASAASKGDACVRLCRAENRGSEIVGVCDHQQKHVLQSGGGRFPLQRLFRLCLTPCADSSQPPINNHPLFDDSETCRIFRESLIRRKACSCESLEHDRTRDLEQKDGNRLERSLEDFGRHELKDSDSVSRLPTALKRITGYSGTPVLLQNRQRLDVGGLFEDPWKLEAEEDEEVYDEGNEASVETGIENAPVNGADSTEEPSIDWDRWCMTQCDNGQGGSACNCDIIP